MINVFIKRACFNRTKMHYRNVFKVRYFLVFLIPYILVTFGSNITTAQTVVATIKVGNGQLGELGVNPTTSLIYAASVNDNNISVIEVKAMRSSLRLKLGTGLVE